MTHQGSPAAPASPRLSAPVPEAAPAVRGWVVEPDRVLCSVCGSPCRPSAGGVSSAGDDADSGRTGPSRRPARRPAGGASAGGAR